MRYLIILMLFITSCIRSPCTPYEFRNDLIYDDRVLITEGFYKGQKGTIKRGTWVHTDSCGNPGFQIKLESGDIVDVDQRFLIKIKEGYDI